MTQLPRISDAEWEVMHVLWGRSPLTANEVIHALEKNSDREKSWSPKTVRTLIHRLVDKGALGVHSDGRLHTYYPLVAEEACLRAETRSFLKRIYGGAMKPFLVHFLKEESLTKEEIEELKTILNEKSQ